MTSLWLDGDRAIPVDEFIPGSSYDTVVVGAGITGLATALLLARSGMKVAVMEARSVGAGTTGNTTAKLSLLQGTVLSALRGQYSQKIVNAYVEANREGQAWLLRYLEDRAVPFQRRDAYTFAVSDEGADRLRSELAVSKAAGLAVQDTTDPGLPFATQGAIRLPDQAQFNPMDVLASLAANFRAHGGVLVEGVRVLGVSRGRGNSIRTDSGAVHAGRVVLATGIPILDRGLYFAKLKASQSYAAAFRVPASTPTPSGMYLSAESPGRSLRTYPSGGEELLIAGGNGHQVGKEPSPKARRDQLLDWTRHHFPGAEVTHTWSGEDYQATNLMPFFGKLPRGRGTIFFATGYNKWGMSNGIAASIAITADILGGQLPWADTIHHRITSPSGAAAAVALNAETFKTMAEGWAKAEKSTSDTEANTEPAEGDGVIVRHGRKPVAVSTVDGVTCRVSAVCTHLRGILGWNDAEKTWDCPLHGSRFTPAGDVLQGPTTERLPAPD